MIDLEAQKRAVARAALELVPPNAVLGVGTGTTANHFIDALAEIRGRVPAAVASSAATAERLRSHGIPVVDLDRSGPLALYVDGADEATRERSLIKGGGGALTREKIVAAASARFVCMIDETKLVARLGAFPLAVEVLPMALAHVTREVERLGWRAVRRAGFVTDNGNAILDLHGRMLEDALGAESALDHVAGVVANGLFCRRPADLLLVARATRVESI